MLTCVICIVYSTHSHSRCLGRLAGQHTQHRSDTAPCCIWRRFFLLGSSTALDTLGAQAFGEEGAGFHGLQCALRAHMCLESTYKLHTCCMIQPVSNSGYHLLSPALVWLAGPEARALTPIMPWDPQHELQALAAYGCMNRLSHFCRNAVATECAPVLPDHWLQGRAITLRSSPPPSHRLWCRRCCALASRCA